MTYHGGRVIIENSVRFWQQSATKTLMVWISDGIHIILVDAITQYKPSILWHFIQANEFRICMSGCIID